MVYSEIIQLFNILKYEDKRINTKQILKHCWLCPKSKNSKKSKKFKKIIEIKNIKKINSPLLCTFARVLTRLIKDKRQPRVGEVLGSCFCPAASRNLTRSCHYDDFPTRRVLPNYAHGECVGSRCGGVWREIQFQKLFAPK